MESLTLDALGVDGFQVSAPGVDALLGSLRFDIDSSLELLGSLGLSGVRRAPLAPLDSEVRG